jgi:hypothetical protein
LGGRRGVLVGLVVPSLVGVLVVVVRRRVMVACMCFLMVVFLFL